jgi:hypothetical protein
MNLRKLIRTLATRLRARRTAVLVLDEFSATQGGRRAAIELVTPGRDVRIYDAKRQEGDA